LTISDADELGRTAPIDVPPEPTSPPTATPDVDGEHPTPPPPTEVVAVQSAAPPSSDLIYVPLAITIGDGFKFGCGFFLAAVLVMLVGFVLLAALFLLTSVLGLNLPITR
jgi:hypothetical protein